MFARNIPWLIVLVFLSTIAIAKQQDECEVPHQLILKEVNEEIAKIDILKQKNEPWENQAIQIFRNALYKLFQIREKSSPEEFESSIEELKNIQEKLKKNRFLEVEAYELMLRYHRLTLSDLINLNIPFATDTNIITKSVQSPDKSELQKILNSPAFYISQENKHELNNLQKLPQFQDDVKSKISAFQNQIPPEKIIVHDDTEKQSLTQIKNVLSQFENLLPRKLAAKTFEKNQQQLEKILQEADIYTTDVYKNIDHENTQTLKKFIHTLKKEDRLEDFIDTLKKNTLEDILNTLKKEDRLEDFIDTLKKEVILKKFTDALKKEAGTTYQQSVQSLKVVTQRYDEEKYFYDLNRFIDITLDEAMQIKKKKVEEYYLLDKSSIRAFLDKKDDEHKNKKSKRTKQTPESQTLDLYALVLKTLKNNQEHLKVLFKEHIKNPALNINTPIVKEVIDKIKQQAKITYQNEVRSMNIDTKKEEETHLRSLNTFTENVVGAFLSTTEAKVKQTHDKIQSTIRKKIFNKTYNNDINFVADAISKRLVPLSYDNDIYWLVRLYNAYP